MREAEIRHRLPAGGSDVTAAGHLDAMKEAEVQRAIVEAARRRGWVVIVTASDKRKRSQEVGLPDLLCWRNDHFLSIEVKRPGGGVRESQALFYEQVAPHLGAHVRHVIAYSAEQVEPLLD